MEWLNYNHLYYFWAVVKQNGVTQAAEKLRLAQSTVSAQLRLLEESLGEKLFKKEGRKLFLTEAGQVVYRYTEEIFSLGQEMTETLRGRPSGKSIQMVVGLTNALPKLIAYRLLQPAFSIPESIYLVCKEESLNFLLGQLALHEIDLVLSDVQFSSDLKIKAYNHLLGECGISFFAPQRLKQKRNQKFPQILDGVDFLLPSLETRLRSHLEYWFEENKIYPHFVAEFADSALLKVFAQSGRGCFAAPSVIEKEIQKQYGVILLGRTTDIVEQFFAISVERKLKNPAVVALCESARKKLFSLG